MAMVRKTLLHRATFAVSILGHGRLFLPCASFSAVPSPVSFAASLVHHRSNEVVLVGNGHSCSSSTLMLVRRSNNINNDSYATTITNKNASFRSCSRLFSSSVDRGPTVSYTYDSDDDDEGDFDDDIKHGDNDDDDDDNIDEPESSDTATPTITKRSHLLYQALFQSLESSLTNLSKKTTSLQRELEKAQSLEETTKQANLIVSNLYRLPPGTKLALVEDWENDEQVVELVLNTKEYGSAQEESDALFALARKVKQGSKVVEGLMKDSLEGETILKEALLDLVSMAGKTMEDLALDGANKIHVEITNIAAALEKESRQKKRKEVLEKNKRRKRKQDDDSMGGFD